MTGSIPIVRFEPGRSSGNPPLACRLRQHALPDWRVAGKGWTNEIADAHARVLILGSLPGQISLQRQQYYALLQNAFWKIMGRLFGAGPDVPYAERSQRLVRSGIVLWDVCATAQRPGSLDAAIIHSSVVPNDLAAFIETYPGVGLIGFNGAKAADLYRRLVLPGLPATRHAIRTETLPRPAQPMRPCRSKKN